MQLYYDTLQMMIANMSEGERPECLSEPHIHSEQAEVWLDCCRHPIILNAVCKALNCNEIVMLMSHLIVKPPHDGFQVYWHQDITYWNAIKGYNIVTVWLALDTVDAENGALQIIPCTHLDKKIYDTRDADAKTGHALLNGQSAVSGEELASTVCINLPPGGFSLHDAYLLHGSEENKSNRWRSGYTIRYANAATTNIDLEQHWSPVYYLCGDGSHCKEGYEDLRL